MKNLKTFALSALSLFGFAACQQVEISPDVKPEATHTVTFVAGAPETKTTVNIDGTTAKFAWTKADEGKFTVYENGTAAQETIGVLGEDGKMTLTATFEGTPQGENSYVAILNKSGNATQIVTEEAYDEAADILVSKAVSSFGDGSGVLLKFRREVAIAKMTLKGLDANENVSKITISSTSGIAGGYIASGWDNQQTSLELYSAYGVSGEDTDYKILANASGEAVVWFTCIPQDEATLTVKVEAADGDTYTKEFSKPITLSRGDVNVFGVAMTKALPSVKTFSLVTSSPADWCGEYVLVAANSGKYYAFDKTLTTENKWGVASEISIENSAIVPSSEGMVITIVKGTSEGTYSIKTNDGNYLSASSKGAFNYGTTYNKDNCDFTISLSDNSVTITQNASTASSKRNLRYNYNGGAGGFRWYDGTTGVLASLYAESGIKYILPSPTNLIVNSETKQVTWDAVADAASYVLTIGSDEFSCESNLYDASAISDEYYDVTVVAVPSDTENYKNSAPATLTDAKFGTPTLATPVLSKGVIDETSVAFSWTKDTRATNGYHWALYNGETLVKEATEASATKATVTDLTYGTTYTAKVYAIAVEGEKPYVQSATATLDLATKAKTTISTIVEEGTGTTKYAISDLTVMAVSGSNFVVKDETGLMFCYKYGATAGDVVTLEGTYEDYQGLKEFKATTYTKASTASVDVDHGTATELNSSNVAAYVNNPVVQYVKANATVAADGTLKVGDVAVYQYGNSLASYAGRTINLYGYTLGYNTEKSNIVLLQTSVEIDQTVPYLSVDPNSKTWESDKTDDAVFTVTTNTAGVKDWSVSPTTLDWATVAVDKNAGTITVTPKDANTAKTANEATLTVTHAAGTLSETITLTQKAKGAPADVKETIDFESASTAYTFWTFTNMTSKQTGSITAKGGTYYGTTGGKATASITTTVAIKSPKSITFYVSKESKNTTSSSWKLQVSSDNKTWTDVKTQSATSMSKGSWVEVTQDLSSYSNVYVRVYYTGSTAVRNIDDLSLTYSN